MVGSSHACTAVVAMGVNCGMVPNSWFSEKATVSVGIVLSVAPSVQETKNPFPQASHRES